MEIDDVSSDGQWMQALRVQKARLQNASKRKGERPKDRKPCRQRAQDFMIYATALKNHVQQNRFMINQSFIAPPYRPCVTPLADLEKLNVEDLRLETHHRGFYLLLRAVTPACTSTAVMAIVEDEKHDGYLLQLYQQKDDQYRQADEVISQNGICIIKEPYLKVTNDGGYSLRVDHISDIVWR